MSDSPRRDAPIDLTAADFRAAGHRLVDRIADFLDTIGDRPVTRAPRPSEMRALLPPGGVPEDGAPAAGLLDEIAPLLFDHSLHNGHPAFLGYITSSAAPIGMLADLLAAAVNPNVGGWQLSPLASEIERQAVRWVAELLRYPPACGGLFVSGGNMANMVAFLVARHARAAGREGGRPLVYTTVETHTWIHKALDLFGLDAGHLREIPVDDGLRADAAALRRLVEADRAAGERPFLVVASGGTVSTGAVDPIREMAAVAGDHGLWLHVDGAYGAPAAVLDDAPADLHALGLADSVAVDPHKWLYAPLEAGCVLVKDPDALRGTFSHTPRYYHFGDAEEPETNFYELGLQNSRGFRALKVWLALRQVGRRGYRTLIGDDVALARRLADRVAAHPELELVSCSLSIVAFRYAPAELRGAGERLDTLNEALLTRLKRGGEVFLSNAVIDGRFLLRACIVNFRTSAATVDALPDLVAREGRALAGGGA